MTERETRELLNRLDAIATRAEAARAALDAGDASGARANEVRR
jgi:hypothetical protein